MPVWARTALDLGGRQCRCCCCFYFQFEIWLFLGNFAITNIVSRNSPWAYISVAAGCRFEFICVSASAFSSPPQSQPSLFISLFSGMHNFLDKKRKDIIEDSAMAMALGLQHTHTHTPVPCSVQQLLYAKRHAAHIEFNVFEYHMVILRIFSIIDFFYTLFEPFYLDHAIVAIISVHCLMATPHLF